MNEVDFSNFDKVLLELVFQNDQETQNRRNTKKLIQRYVDKISCEEQQILALKKDISLSDENIWDLQKYNRNTDSLVMCSATSAVLEREKKFLQSQLENAINTTENDKKNYQDSINKCTEILKQHEEKYKGFAFAKKYHAIKEELDSLLSNITDYDEQQKRKQKIIQDISGPTLFGSYVDWGLRLATLRKDTNETIYQSSQSSRTTTEMMKNIEELEKKIKYIYEHTQNTSEKQTGRNERSRNNTDEFQQESHDEEESRLNQSKEKRSHMLHLPDLFNRPSGEITSHFRTAEKGYKENIGELQNNNSIVSNQVPCLEPFINNKSKGFSPATDLQCQGQLRLGLIQKKIHSKLNIKETEIRRQQFTDFPDTSKDSGYFSQGNSVSSEDIECRMDETPPKEVFASPSVPSPFIVPNTPSVTANTSIKKRELNKGKKNQKPSKSSMDLFSKTTEASPCLNLFKTSTPKTPNLKSFDSFATVRFADQQESFTPANTVPTSPAKHIGNLFQNMEGDEEFPFLFTTKSSQASDDDKDDFNFMLPFGQEGRNSMEFESTESSSFSFF
ncbi:protein SIX6OS1 isoform X2 [Engystomops pustulosus]|uniref:protein SIX6OS1 isoform X2 n=1 Tax=Engystomops pustulosus TaxID=76066 RepID=UPI003AFB7E3B